MISPSAAAFGPVELRLCNPEAVRLPFRVAAEGMDLALAALIAAYHESAEPGLLRATLPLAGRTVIERQARIAAAAGAAPIIVLAERMPPVLGAALDRLRRERIPVQVARTAEEAVQAVDPSDRLLLVADGAIAEASELGELGRGQGRQVLTVADGAFGDPYERIDAASRWGGFAALDGALLRETVSMLGEWDLQSTLLRRALQAGATHVAAQGPVAILDGPADLAGLERQILATAGETRGGWASWLLAPIERTATFALMGGPLGPDAVGGTAALLTGLGAAAMAYGWRWTGLVLLLLATPLEGIGARLARLRMQDDVGKSWWCHLLPVLAGAALAGLGYALAPVHGWGIILLAFTTLAFLVALGIETEGRTIRFGAFLAERKGLAWLMLPFAIFGVWRFGIAMLFAYSAASFFWAQREAHRPSPRPQD